MSNRVLLLVVAGALVLSGCARKQETADPKDLIATAWNEYTLGEFVRAVTKFESAAAQTEILSSAEGRSLHLKALYGLATTWNLRRPGEDQEKAVDLYRRIIAAAPGEDLAAWSLLALARMKHLVPVGKDPDYDEVRKAYQDVIDRYPNHLAAKEAFVYQQSTLISSLDPEQTRRALAALGEFVKDLKTPFIGPAWSLIAVGNMTLGNPEKRLEAEIESLNRTEVDPENPFTEFCWQYWNIATIAEFEVGDFETARRYYRKLIEEYPTDIRVFGCRQALKRMGELEAKIREEL